MAGDMYVIIVLTQLAMMVLCGVDVDDHHIDRLRPFSHVNGQSLRYSSR